MKTLLRNTELERGILLLTLSNSLGIFSSSIPMTRDSDDDDLGSAACSQCTSLPDNSVNKPILWTLATYANAMHLLLLIFFICPLSECFFRDMKIEVDLLLRKHFTFHISLRLYPSALPSSKMAAFILPAPTFTNYFPFKTSTKEKNMFSHFYHFSLFEFFFFFYFVFVINLHGNQCLD